MGWTEGHRARLHALNSPALLHGICTDPRLTWEEERPLLSTLPIPISLNPTSFITSGYLGRREGRRAFGPGEKLSFFGYGEKEVSSTQWALERKAARAEWMARAGAAAGTGHGGAQGSTNSHGLSWQARERHLLCKHGGDDGAKTSTE